MVKRKGNHTGETKKYFICAETIKDANGVRIIGLIKTGKDWRVVKMSEEEARKIIDKIKQEEFPYALAIAKAYEKLQQENEELKKNLFSSDQVETICPKCGEKISINYSREVYDLKYTLTEFEKWLEEKIYEKVEPPFKNWEDERIEYYLNRREGFKECLDKLQELKEGSRSE